MTAQQEKRGRRYLVVAIVLISIGIVTLTFYLARIPQLKWLTNPFVYGVACLLILSGIILWIVDSYHIFHNSNWSIPPYIRRVIIPVGIALLIIGTFFGIAGSLWKLPDQIANIVSVLFTSLGLLMALLSLPSSTPETQSQFGPHQQLQPLQPALTGTQTSTPYRPLLGVPPPHNTRDIQPYLTFANDIYATLTKFATPVTAVAITGYADELVSMLAARICWEASRKRQANDSPFEAGELWLSVNHETTLKDIVGTLCQIQNTMPPDFALKTTQELANVLLDALNASGKSRLIVLDRFEKWQDRRDNTGVEECLNVLNSQVCSCRVLITCHTRYHRGSNYPHARLVERPFRKVSTTIKTLAKPRNYVREADEEVILSSSQNLIKETFTKELTPHQRRLLYAFSIYPEKIPLAQALLLADFSSRPVGSEVNLAIDNLVERNLLERCGRDGFMISHSVVKYAQDHYMDITDKEKREKALRKAHRKAAQYYQREAEIMKWRGDPRTLKNWIDAVWHLCEAGKMDAAYKLAQRESLFNLEPQATKDAQLLLELCRLIQPSDDWHPDYGKLAVINDCRGRVNNFMEQASHAS